MEHTRHGYWLEEAGGVEPAEPLSGERRADVVVIGGGYTGMWAAWQLKALEPEARVVLLEGEMCGHGPSGRNGGFCNEMWFSLPNMRQRWGDEAALAVARASRDAVAGIESFCREQEVDAWFRRGGYLQVSTAPAQDEAWLEALVSCRQLDAAEAIQPLSPAEVAARCASPAFRAGALYSGAATIQPARLALGLRERLRAAGVEVFERSPVRRLENLAGEVVARTAGGAEVLKRTAGGDEVLKRAPLRHLRADHGGFEAATPGGTVRAGAAVVAIGGAAKAPGAPLQNALTVTSSHIVLTEPVPDLLEEVGWTGGECITDSRTLIDYFRTTPDGRIAFGWGGGRIAPGARLHRRAEVDGSVVALTAARLHEYFPTLAGAGSGTGGGRRRNVLAEGHLVLGGEGKVPEGGERNGSVRGEGDVPVGGGRRGPIRITHAWGGPIDVSPTHLPLVLPLSGGRAFAAAGYTGNGVGPSYMVGRTLASLALDRRDDHSRLAFVDPAPQRVPPEPLHWLGGETIRSAIVRKEVAELAGRHPDPVSSLLSRIPDLIGFHIGR